MRFAIRAIFALSFTFFSSAYAQLVVASSAPGGTILCSGSVTDTTGAALAHAAVSLTQAGEAPLTTRTDNAGRFGLQVTKPAIGWTLTVTAPGFQEYAVPFDASLPAPLTIRLQVEAQSEQIEVQSVGGGNIEPTETQLGSALSQEQLGNTPVNGRSLTGLLALTPGVVPVSSVQPNAVVMSGVASTPPSGDLDIGALSVSGQRETANAFHVNGANVQEDVNMGIAIVPMLDSVATLEVLTSSFDARLGNQSGGQIAVFTRSGTSRMHGSVYDYFRNTALDARNYFSLVRAPFHQNQFGGTFGGAVPHTSEFFYFVDYQGTRQTQGMDTGRIAVPSLADRGGDLADQQQLLTGSVSAPFIADMLSSKLQRTIHTGDAYSSIFPGGQIPSSVFSAPAQHLLQYIPKPNYDAGSFSTSSYAQRIRDDKGSVRLDRTTRWGKLSGYYFLDDYSLLNPYPTAQGGATVPGFNAESDGRAQLYSLNLVSSSANSVNQAHLSYMRNAAAVGQPHDGVGPSLASQGFVSGANTDGINPLLPNIEGVANVIFNGFTMGVDVTSLFQAENIYEVSDDYSHTLGAHTISLGANLHADQINTHPTVYDNGSFSFTGSETGSDFADFLIGVDSSYTQGQGESFYNRNHYIGLYAQDSWQIHSQLTLNYGFRWDVLPPWSEKFNQLLTLDPNEQSVVFPNAPQGILFPGDPGVPNTLSPTRYGNIAPRFAFSWAPQTNWSPLATLFGAPGKTVLRGGFAIYYSAFEGLAAGIMSGCPPYGFTYTSAAPTLFDQPFASAGQRFPLQHVAYGATAAHPDSSVDWSNFEPLTGIPAFAKDNVDPYTENYSVSVERQLAAHTALTLSYVGTQAHHLLVIQEMNPGDPAACLALSTAASVAAGSATCGPFGESSTYVTAGGATVQGTRTAFNAAFGSVNLQRTIANSHDNALELSLKHSTPSLFVQLGYTWSRSLDESSSLAEPVYPGNAGRSRALSAFDLTHNFVATYRYTLPLARFIHGHANLTDGWQISGLTRMSSGFPVTLINNNDTSLLGTQPNGINNKGVDEPNFPGGDLKLNRHPGAGGYAFNKSLFSLPALGTMGNARRRFFYGPGADNTDLALQKSTKLRQNTVLELRMETFNLFNHAQFFGPAAVNGNISSSGFGQIQSSSPPRLMQLAARIKF